MDITNYACTHGFRDDSREDLPDRNIAIKIITEQVQCGNIIDEDVFMEKAGICQYCNCWENYCMC